MRPPLSEGQVVGQRRRAIFQSNRATPVACDFHQPCLVLFRRGAERIIGRAEPARVTSDHDQRRCAFGIGRREQRAHRAALRIAEQRSPLRSNGVQHGAHVVHALFERRDVDHPIGKSIWPADLQLMRAKMTRFRSPIASDWTQAGRDWKPPARPGLAPVASPPAVWRSADYRCCSATIRSRSCRSGNDPAPPGSSP